MEDKISSIFPTPILQTPRLILREIYEGDWPEILHLRSDETVNALVKRPLSKSKEDAVAFILKAEENNEAEKIAWWGIVLPEHNKVLGTVCLWQFSEDRKEAELGYDLRVEAQGRGYMREAAKAVLEFGFGKLGLLKVEAYTQSNNAASIHMLDHFGFELDSSKKDDGNLLNTVYALKVDDYYSPKR